jgi:hypothetical protein
MTQATLVRDLFDLPEHIRKGDFVLKLAEGIEDARGTAETYVVTPALAEAFDRALTLVGSALRDQKSQAAYLHGSFGSGKSHFMALLSLLLAGKEEAWRIAELHSIRAKHGFVGAKKLLELHYHMLDKESIESAVFDGYLEWVRASHPEAPVPALFADEQLFQMAAELLEELGEERFFARMNEGAGGDARWGKAARVWDRARFEAAASSSDPKVRAELFSALVKKRFSGWEQSSRGFIDFDSGLAVMAAHAKSLGYDAVVLFLDELILWLSGLAADAARLHREVHKMVKLVEAEDMHRAVPIVSFIAKQRHLGEMVGQEFVGAESQRLRKSLEHWDERYSQVELEDRNLPAIIERRILKPASAEARGTLEAAFDALRRGGGSSWQTLLGAGDAAAFRKLYPFSPALVDVLVALSNSLQRQRTAIKLLMEVLVEHISDLKLGEVVRVGDLFDVLAGGDESADGVMKARFAEARRLYRVHFLPVLQEQNGTDTPARCQRLRPDHPTRLGCSGCPEAACRTDNRLVKTLLIAALVPEVPAVKDLTASRLVQLNHGSIKVPIPGTEASIAAQKLKAWAAAVGQLHVGNEADPSVRLRLEGVDLGPILEKARHVDNEGNRTRVIRELLFEALGLEKVLERGKDHKVDWRGTSRVGHIQFGNVRTMGPELLRCAEGHHWRLVVDYPFDHGQFGPADDLRVIDSFKDQGAGSWTLVWLPSFFSDGVKKLLGDLVVLEEILQTPTKAREYVADYSVENQSRAISDLENLRSMKKGRLLQVLEEAYGLARAKEGDLDSARMLDQHLQLLKPGARLEAPVPPNLAEAVDVYVGALLSARWPRHPRLEPKLTPRRVESLVQRFGELLDQDKKLAAERAELDEMRGTLGELGLVRVSESAVHLVEDKTLQELEKRRQQQSIDAPTVGQVRRWIDESGKMGLLADAEDLIARCYARWSARTFTHFGGHFQPKAGQSLPHDVVLEKPDLPGHAAWVAALNQAGHVFGISLPGKALHAENLKRFEAALRERIAAASKPVTALPGLLGRWAGLVGVSVEADRLVTARSGDELIATLAGKGAVAQVNALAAFRPRTSPQALGRSVKSAEEVVRFLGDALARGVFEQLVHRRDELAGAAGILERAGEALRQDDLHVALTERLRALAEEGQQLVAGPAPGPVAPAPTFRIEAVGRRAALAELARVTQAIEELDEEAVVVGHITIKTRR